MTGHLRTIATLVDRHERSAAHALNLAPSENVLSPLARLPFVLDMYGRYFFDDLPRFGVHAFFGGLEPGEVETGVLEPLLREMTGAAHVNTKALSGLNCMTIALAALADAGDRVLCVPPSGGGHTSTIPLGTRLGMRMDALPMDGPYDVDLDALAATMAADPPALVYLDQSTQLFPIDPRPIRRVIDELGLPTRLHHDASHVNGLILGGALPNPLERGAHSFGGSTHKTLPGPHKGFLATNDPGIAASVDEVAAVFVSQHQPAAVVSLAITLVEMLTCDGPRYARTIVSNARRLARRLDEAGLTVPARDRGYTECHQVWVDPAADDGALAATARLAAAGVHVNRFGGLPGIPRPAFRLSTAEFTRLGAEESDVDDLADLLVGLVTGSASAHSARDGVVALRDRLDRPRYRTTEQDWIAAGFDPAVLDLLGHLDRAARAAERV